MSKSLHPPDPADTVRVPTDPQRPRLPESLAVLNRVLADLNRAADVRAALAGVLARLVQALGLQAGWIVLRDARATDARAGRGFTLAAHYGLPPPLAVSNESVWEETCACEARCAGGTALQAWNEVACPRLARLAPVGQRGPVHACAPLRAGARVLGVLNVVAEHGGPLPVSTLRLLARIGREVGRALRRARLYEDLVADQVREQRALEELSRALLGRGSLDEIVRELLRAVRRALRADAASLLLPGTTPGLLAVRSASGWRDDPAESRRRLRADLHCTAWLAMRSRRPVVIGDLRRSPARAWLAPWERAEDFRGQVVIPLVVERQPVGALAVNARVPRRFTESEIRFLQLMANQAAIAIETARLREEEAQRRNLEGELALAREIQRTMLPHEHLDVPGWEIATAYRAAQEVGGDFYDVLELPGPGRRLGLVVGDVAGKSVSGALLMTLSLTAIRDAVLRTPSPAAILCDANERIVRQIRPDRFVSALFGALETTSGSLLLANAGQCRPLLWRAATGELLELATRGIILGVQAHPVLEERALTLAAGDVLVLYSDGVTEARSPRRALYGEERLQAAVSRSARGGARAVVEHVLAGVAAFAGPAAPSDDLTLVVVARAPLPDDQRVAK